MRILQNQQPPSPPSAASTVAPEHNETTAHRPKRITFFGVLFLLTILVIFSGIVFHYSQFGTGGKFILRSEDSGIAPLQQGQGEYQRLLVRNRYPFVLMIVTCLCRVEGDKTSPHFSVVDLHNNVFNGNRSFYSGTFESHLTFAVSDEGFFVVTDQSGEPWGQLEKTMTTTETSHEISPHIDPMSYRPVLPEDLVDLLKKAVQNDDLSGISQAVVNSPAQNGKPIDWFCTLPGDNSDLVLVVSITPVANYE